MKGQFRGFTFFMDFPLSVHFIMTADIQQDDFLIGNDDGQGGAITVDDADSLNAFELAAGGGILKGRDGLFYLSSSPSGYDRHVLFTTSRAPLRKER